jgi:aerobic C4-dicarboxylate transport protein
VNLIGNCLAAIVVGKWEGAIDETLLAEKLGRR